MSGNEGLELTTSDESLVERTRSGDQRAFAELWRRHYRSGARVARQFTSSIDADDLVSEAYTRIYQRVLAGGGPTGAFRPYLYTTIRNLASTWGAASKHVQVDDIADFEDPDTIEDPAAIALDKTLTARAFRSLPERWQSVLWYTEVEGMDPHEVAPILGLTANGVAALSYRAREGLRKAWLQAHINDASASGECQWAISKLGEHARHALASRDLERIQFHLTTCAKCAIISEEVDEVGSRLAFVMLPLVLGGAVGGAVLSSVGHASVAVAAAAIPAAPIVGAAGAAATVTTTAGLVGGAIAPVALVGTLAIAVAITGGVVLDPPSSEPTTASSSSSEPNEAVDAAAEAPVAEPSVDGTVTVTVPGTGSAPVTTLPSGSPVVPVDDPAHVGELVGTVTEVTDPLTDTVTEVVTGITDPLPEVVDSVVDTITDDNGSVADVSISLGGTGTPGAHLSLQAAGQVYATATVGPDGSYSISVDAIPGGLASLDLVQTIDREYLQGLLPNGGLLGSLLGTVDSLIDELIRPLHLSNTEAGGISINLVG